MAAPILTVAERAGRLAIAPEQEIQPTIKTARRHGHASNPFTSSAYSLRLSPTSDLIGITWPRVRTKGAVLVPMRPEEGTLGMNPSHGGAFGCLHEHGGPRRFRATMPPVKPSAYGLRSTATNRRRPCSLHSQGLPMRNFGLATNAQDRQPQSRVISLIFRSRSGARERPRDLSAIVFSLHYPGRGHSLQRGADPP